MLYHTFSFHAPAPSWIDTSLLTLSLHDALPILAVHRVALRLHGLLGARLAVDVDDLDVALLVVDGQWQQAVLAGVRDGHLGALLDRLAGAAGRAGEGAHDADLDWPRLRPRHAGPGQQGGTEADAAGGFHEPAARHAGPVSAEARRVGEEGVRPGKH